MKLVCPLCGIPVSVQCTNCIYSNKCFYYFAKNDVIMNFNIIYMKDHQKIQYLADKSANKITCSRAPRLINDITCPFIAPKITDNTISLSFLCRLFSEKISKQLNKDARRK